MRFLADESCDFAVVRALREAGHDVLAIREVSPRAEDSAVVDRAHREERLLLTEDRISASSCTRAAWPQAESSISVSPRERESASPKLYWSWFKRRESSSGDALW